MDNSPQLLGLDAEKRVATKLKQMGYAVGRKPYNSPFDLTVNGRRLEVKCARPNASGHWRVNFHRHGKLNEKHVDAYVIVLDAIPGYSKKSLFLVIPAPIRRATMDFRFATLVCKYSSFIENWKALGLVADAVSQKG